MINDTRHLTPAPDRVILLTGFDPFGADTVNPSWLVAQALDGQRIAGHRVVAAQLSTVFGKSLRQLEALVATHRPALVVCLGQAGGRNALSLERVGINIDDARIPDNAGKQPIDAVVLEDGPPAYFSTLPIKAMAKAMIDAGIAASVSNTAGTFVCNHIFYAVMDRLAKGAAAPGARGGFIHIPPLPDQHGKRPDIAGIDLQTQIAGIRIALEVAMTTTQDLRVTAGQIS